MKISVIVPVRNESKQIRQVVEGLCRQDYPRDEYEVLVVDGASDDDTAAIVESMRVEYPQLQLHRNPRRLSSAARNIGVRHATGDYVIVVDGHCTIADSQHLRKLERAFVTSGADTIGRPQPLVTSRPSGIQRCVSIARSSWLGHNPDSAIYTARESFVSPANVAVAYKRELFSEVGLFDERFDACEDVELNTRLAHAGRTCWFTPDIAVGYTPRSSLAGLFYQMIRYGRGRCRLARVHPGSLTLPALVPAALLVWLVVGGIAAALSVWAAWLFAATMLVYGLVIGTETLRSISAKFELGYVRVPVVFLTIHLGFGWGFLRELVWRAGR